MLHAEAEPRVSGVALMDSAVEQKNFCVTCVSSQASRTGTCTMEPGAPSTRTGTSGSRWTPSTSPCSPESSCRAETPSGGQVVSGFKWNLKLLLKAKRPLPHSFVDGMIACLYRPENWLLVLPALHRSWDWVHTYKVQLSNDSVSWETCMNGTEEAVRATFCSVFSDMRNAPTVSGGPHADGKQILKRLCQSEICTANKKHTEEEKTKYCKKVEFVVGIITVKR